jgi:hypothetical protein
MMGTAIMTPLGMWIFSNMQLAISKLNYRSGFKISDQVQGQGGARIGSGAYTLVREHFNTRGNAAIGP